MSGGVGGAPEQSGPLSRFALFFANLFEQGVREATPGHKLWNGKIDLSSTWLIHVDTKFLTLGKIN